MSDLPVLLTDEQVLAFVVQGYHLVEPDLPEGLNEAVTADLDARPSNPGNGIYDALPQLKQVYEHPQVRGALISLLGPGYRMNPHRHWHTKPPHSASQGWHQDGTNVRHHQVWCVLAMYYPHDVSLEMGPTVIMPGTHLRNCPTDRMQTYANLKGQAALAVKAGTVAITHYDLWHAGSANRTDRTRHMLKFLFDRTEAPAKPTWNHDPDRGMDVGRAGIKQMVGALGYGSDYYKEWELRTEMWQWLLGRPQHVSAGAFKDMLG